MEPVTVRKLDDRTETARKAAGIFVDAYYDDLKEISGSREILIDIFSKSLILSHFYGAYSCDSLMGIFALSDEKERSFRLDKRAVIEKIGFMKGHIVYGVLKRELERPIRMNKPGVYIEAVATDPGAQGRGIATKMMRHTPSLCAGIGRYQIGRAHV